LYPEEQTIAYSDDVMHNDTYYAHGTVHLGNTSFYKIPTRCNFFCLFGFL